MAEGRIEDGRKLEGSGGLTNLSCQKVLDKATRRSRLVREGKSKIVARTIWMLITRKCPLECRHCYFCGSPDGETLTLPQIERIIQHLPSGIESLGISGGEPFTNRKSLYGTLKLIRKRDFPHLTSIIVQTIGFWAESRALAERVVGELIDLGVTRFFVYGHDNWHWESGLNRERQEMLVDVLRNEFHAEEPRGTEAVRTILQRDGKITLSFRETAEVRPIGRAAWATTPEEWKSPSANPLCNCRDFLHLNPDGYLYTVNFNGEVHYCLFQVAKSLGNIIERPLTDILKSARRNKFFQIMNKGDVVDFGAEYFGIPKKEARASIEKKGRCVFHYELLTRYFKGRKDAPVMYDVFRREKRRWENRHSQGHSAAFRKRDVQA